MHKGLKGCGGKGTWESGKQVGLARTEFLLRAEQVAESCREKSARDGNTLGVVSAM